MLELVTTSSVFGMPTVYSPRVIFSAGTAIPRTPVVNPVPTAVPSTVIVCPREAMANRRRRTADHMRRETRLLIMDTALRVAGLKHLAERRAINRGAFASSQVSCWDAQTQPQGSHHREFRK